MTSLHGQAAASLGATLHRIGHLLLALGLILGLVVLAAAWRLSRGPVDLELVKPGIEAIVNREIAPAHIALSGASIAWDGFQKGLNQPLTLRVTGVELSGSADLSSVKIPQAVAALSMRGLLLGEIRPRTVALDGARIALIRDASGTIAFDLGSATEATHGSRPSPLTGLIAALSQPAASDMLYQGGPLGQLESVSIHGADARLDDRLMGHVWTAERADVDFTRHPGGGVDGQAKVSLAIGGEPVTAEASFTVAGGARSAHAAVHVGKIGPRALAATMPALAPLEALDAPVSLDAEGDLDSSLMPTRMRLGVQAGAGKIKVGDGWVTLKRGGLTVAGTPDAVAIETADLEVQARPKGPVTTIRANGNLARAGGRVTATLNLTTDRVSVADLPVLWPPWAGPPARAWITANITAGTAHDGKVHLVLDAPADMSDATLTQASGTMEAEDISVTWMPRVPQVEQARAHLVLTNPDTLEIAVKSGRQTVRPGEPIQIHDCQITISGLAAKDQVAKGRCGADGPVASGIALLKEPRLRILDKHPMDLRDPAGTVSLTLTAVVPLELKLSLDDVTIQTKGTLSGVHLSGLAGGGDLDRGNFAFDADTNGMMLKGKASLAGIDADIDGKMDFRSGLPSGVVQTIHVAGRLAARDMAGLGVDPSGYLSGDIGLTALLTSRRDGQGELSVTADLAQTAIDLAPLGWHKAKGGAAVASARLMLKKDRLDGIDRIEASGPALVLRASAETEGNQVTAVNLTRLTVGRTDLTGTLRRPAPGPIALDLMGSALDLSALLAQKPEKHPPGRDPMTGPEWSLKARFDRVFLANNVTATGVAASATGKGQIARTMALTAMTAPGKPLALRIEPVGPTRHLSLTAADAGSVLSGAGITETMKGGLMTVNGDFDDRIPEHRLSGTLEISDFRVTKLAALGKLLQAVTFYGLVDALRGEGLGFLSLTAPFALDDQALTLHDVRAFSASLGVTAKGRIDRAADSLDLEGTLVPAYIFNSFLGRLPLVGKLFSNETGGGLVAMNYGLHGPLDDPSVSANPLSALTPGILRRLFGLFDTPPLDQAGPGGKAPARQ